MCTGYVQMVHYFIESIWAYEMVVRGTSPLTDIQDQLQTKHPQSELTTVLHFLFLGMLFCPYVYLCTSYMPGSCRSQNRPSNPLELDVTADCENTCGCRESNTGSLKAISGPSLCWALTDSVHISKLTMSVSAGPGLVKRLHLPLSLLCFSSSPGLTILKSSYNKSLPYSKSLLFPSKSACNFKIIPTSCNSYLKPYWICELLG